MSLLTKTQIEDLRFALLEEIVAASLVALSAEMLLRRVRRRGMIDFEATVAQAEIEIGALHGLGLVTVVPNPVGGVPYYQASPTGVLASRRGVT